MPEAMSQLNSMRTLAGKVGSKMKSLGNTMSSVGQSMLTFVSLPIAGALGYSIKQASDLNETISKTDVVFGNASDAVLEWSTNTLKSVGLAQGTSLDMVSTYGDMATSMGYNQEKASELSMSIVELAGDMASFKNMNPEQVHTALTGIFTGETEALKSLGIVMTETNLKEYARQQGITKSIEDMTQAEKVQLRYNYVMDMASNSIGDFTRTQDSSANQMRIFTESIKELGAKIGELLLPTFTEIVKWLNKAVEWFSKLDPSIQGIIVKLALFLAVIAPILIAGGFLISTLGTIITFIAGLSIEVVAIVLVITGFVAVLAGVIIKTGLWRDILERLKVVGGLVLNVLKEMWEALKQGEDPISKALEMLQKLTSKNTDLSNAIGLLKEKWEFFSSRVKELLEDLWTKFQEAWAGIWEVVQPFFQRLQDEVLPIFIETVGYILELLGEMASNFKENLDLIWEAWKKVWNKIKPYVESALDLTATIIKNSMEIIKNTVKLAIAILKGDWKGAWTAIKNIIKAGSNNSVAIWKKFKSLVIKVIKSLASMAKSRIKQLGSDLVSAIKAKNNLMYNAGKNLMRMLISGISSKIQAIKDKVSTVSGIVGDFLGWSSPTKEGAGKNSHKWMPNMMNMFKQGILDNIPAIQSALEAVGATIQENQPVITPGFSEALDTTSSTSGKNSSNVVLQVNNPKIFDTNDINKFMTPVVARLRQVLGGVNL
jgi:phage-related protein